VKPPTFSVEVITLPVSDVERALRFYVDQAGSRLDVDYSPNDAFRVVQLTPPGSSCSIQIGKGLTDAPAGSLRNVNLVRGWPALTEKTVAGIHFVQEDSPNEIGKAIAHWMLRL
jgi:catechol 2,3-dioxygenase-like lactoylglutathione lyase family enzyme